MRTERQKEQRRKYEASSKGKTAKKRHEEAYKASGGRFNVEARRASKPISDARKAYKAMYQVMRRSSERNLNELDAFVLSEALGLAKLREKLLGASWHVDHIVPVSKGGTSSAFNLQVVPALWNRQKSNKHSNTFFSVQMEL
jgi:hypothetical protein